MLGWFKKKFGKQAPEPAAVEPELSPAVESELIQEAADEVVEPIVAAEVQPDAVPPAEPVVEESQCSEIVPPEPVAEQVAEIDTIAESSAARAAETIEAVAEEPPVSEAVMPEAQAEAHVVTEEPTSVQPEPSERVELDAEWQTATAPDEMLVVEEVPDLPGSAEAPSPAAVVASFAPTQEKPASKSLFKRLRERLGKTRDSFIYRLDRLFLGKKEIDQDLFEQLEEILITADLGVGTTMALLDEARKKVKRDQLSDPQALKTIIRDQLLAYIVATDQPAELVMPAEGPFVIMVVGVNGVGKTTTIGKLAAKFVRSGQSVLLVAADTFRAAAINQLRIWGERVGVEVIAQNPGADPSSVVFDGLEYGVAHHHDVIIIDTAGRLHTSVNLMEELKKIKRVVGKKMPGAPHEVMLVLDATTGQNGISQAKLFHEAVGVSGLALTKLDGTAKGGIVANVSREIKIPVRFIGIGEQIDDLRDFDAREFVDALFDRQAD